MSGSIGCFPVNHILNDIVTFKIENVNFTFKSILEQGNRVIAESPSSVTSYFPNCYFIWDNESVLNITVLEVCHDANKSFFLELGFLTEIVLGYE